MVRLRHTVALCCVLVTAGAAHAADFSYQQTTQITGGSMLQMMKMAGTFSSAARKAGEPLVTTVYLQDNRKATVSPDSIEIVDLDKEAVTHVDLVKHSYYTMTFAEMRARMEAAQAKAEKQAEKEKHQPAPDAGNNHVQASFDVKVRNTGAHKMVSGLDTNEAILTMTMTMTATDTQTQQSGAIGITNDMWMVEEIPGYDKVRDFDRRYAEKMAVVMGVGGQDFSRMLVAHPGAGEAMGKMVVEMQKLHGVPVTEIMRMGPTADGKPIPAASEMPLPPPSPTPSGGDLAKQALVNSLPFGFGHKKNQDQSANQNGGANGTAAQSGVAAILMETQITSSNFSATPIDPSHFEAPPGMKQVTAPEY